MPSRIVSYVHRYKRPPKKRKAVALDVPAVVLRAGRRPADEDRKPAIVTAKNPHRRGRLPEMTPEEHQRRGDAADALWRELVCQATGK